jgi:hypothetical protein
MAFEGGPLNVVGITPSYVTGLATQTASSGIPQALGQVWQGSGQSFFGSAGQALAGGLASSAVNVALNSAFGTNVVGPQGLKLDSGANILASTITPYVTGAVAGGINQQIQQSLKNAGPFGPLLSSFGTQAVNQVFNSATNAIFGATDTATNYKMFPGGGGPGESPADYGGSSYTLTDVVFSLQRANQGPQAFGESQTISLPKTLTTVGIDQFTSAPPVANNTANVLKKSAMVNGLSKKAFSTNIPFAL